MIAHKLPVPASPREAQAAVQRVLKPGKNYIMQILHDDWCRAIKTGRDIDCAVNCRPDYYLLELEPSDSIEPMPGGGHFVAFGGGRVDLQ